VVTAYSMAGMFLLLVLPLAVATIGSVILIIPLVASLIDILHVGTGAYPGALLLTTGLALLLVPLAWWRLAEVELP
jgi:hypothetical protein